MKDLKVAQSFLDAWEEQCEVAESIQAEPSISMFGINQLLKAQAKVTEARVRKEAAKICAKMKIEYAGKLRRNLTIYCRFIMIFNLTIILLATLSSASGNKELGIYLLLLGIFTHLSIISYNYDHRK